MRLWADRAAALLSGIALLAAAVPSAHGQANLDAGKSPAQIFSSTCNVCHRSARDLKRTSPAFMRQHYTTGMREAIAMAGYLASVRAEQQRRAAESGIASAPVPPVPGVPGVADQTGTELQAALASRRSLRAGKAGIAQWSFEDAPSFGKHGRGRAGYGDGRLRDRRNAGGHRPHARSGSRLRGVTAPALMESLV